MGEYKVGEGLRLREANNSFGSMQVKILLFKSKGICVIPSLIQIIKPRTTYEDMSNIHRKDII